MLRPSRLDRSTKVSIISGFGPRMYVEKIAFLASFHSAQFCSRIIQVDNAVKIAMAAVMFQAKPLFYPVFS